MVKHNKPANFGKNIIMQTQEEIALVIKRLNKFINKTKSFDENSAFNKLSHFTYNNGIVSLILIQKKDSSQKSTIGCTTAIRGFTPIEQSKDLTYSDEESLGTANEVQEMVYEENLQSDLDDVEENSRDTMATKISDFHLSKSTPDLQENDLLSFKPTKVTKINCQKVESFKIHKNYGASLGYGSKVGDIDSNSKVKESDYSTEGSNNLSSNNHISSTIYNNLSMDIKEVDSKIEVQPEYPDLDTEGGVQPQVKTSVRYDNTVKEDLKEYIELELVSDYDSEEKLTSDISSALLTSERLSTKTPVFSREVFLVRVSDVLVIFEETEGNITVFKTV